jgi:hypothetical protein
MATDKSTYVGHPSDDLVPGDNRECGISPFVAGGMDIRMADSAVQDIYGNIMWTGFSTFDAKRN